MLERMLADLIARHGLTEQAAADLRRLLELASQEAASATWLGEEPAVDGENTLDPPSSDLVFTEPTSRGASRYEDLGLIGMGAMGEVRRVRDRSLGRTMAMKILRSELVDSRRAILRFIAEAQATAQLQHPGVVPVHELGRLADGRLFFTMKEIRGRELGDVIREVHGALGESTWTFRRLVAAFHAACEAVACAHAKGVVHRDLKPPNVMLGEFGEVVVVDWGLAKVRGREEVHLTDEDQAIITARSRDAAEWTRAGAVAGTPAYMPPEQAQGAVDAVDARSDVYALGAILYEILSGRVPYRRRRDRSVLEQVLDGPPPPVEETRPRIPLPDDLVLTCRVAMSRNPELRHPDAGALAAEIGAWLDGARKREQALAMVGAAHRLAPEVTRIRAEAEQRRTEAQASLDALEPWAPEPTKASAWAEQDEAARLARQAELLDLKVLNQLQGALSVDPGLAEAHAAMADRYRARLAMAEAQRDAAATVRAEARLRMHARALPEGHPDRERHLAWLDGEGELALATDPPATRVVVHRYEPRGRRLEPVLVRETERAAVRLPRGSYLVTLSCAGRPDLRYPVHLGREERWPSAPPGSDEPPPVPFPVALDADECHVPAGWAWTGGDPDAPDSRPRQRVWVDAFTARRFPVTNAEYIAFLDDLVDRGREDEALDHAPRERPGTAHAEGALVYGRDEHGHFLLRADADGDLWRPDWPVMLVTWAGAQAYARWYAARTGQPWRLPLALEWEKAARGVDGRFFVWGDHLDPSWCAMRTSHPGRPLPVPVTDYPMDESVYGLRGMCGGVREWCLDAWDPRGGPVPGDRALLHDVDAAHREVRGGSWYALTDHCRLAARVGVDARSRSSYVGFRLVR